ncbi:MAG TPA: arylamine N-acetyltransferase [Vicinamibacteria bacterium]
MGDSDLASYLARIGYRGRLEPDVRTLVALHAAHVTAVPFENLDILLGRRISLELGTLQAKIVEGRRGGYCFEQNTLFQAMLERLGFRVTPLAARVRAGMAEIRPRTHMLLRVELDEGAWLADVGFGGDGLVHPLSFAPGAEVRTAGLVHRLRREGDLWVLTADRDGERSDLYAFTLEAQHAVDYEMANHYTSTWPDSKFVQTLTAQRSWPEGRAILRNRDLTVREAGSVRTETIRDPEHLLRVLEREFGLSFPPGTRFTRPEF